MVCVKRLLAGPTVYEEHGLGLKEIQETIAKIDPLPGAKEFLDELRATTQTVILSDTFEEFAKPLMKKLGWPTILCNSLTVAEDGEITDCFEEEIALRRLMCRRANRSVFLCDGSKIGKTSPYLLCGAGEVDAIVCDLPVPAPLRAACPSLVWIDHPVQHRGDGTLSQKKSSVFGEK